MSGCIWSSSSEPAAWLLLSLARHSNSSLGEHAVKISSYNWLSHKNTIFQECSTEWHWSPASSEHNYRSVLDGMILPRPLSTSSTLMLFKAIQA